MTGVPPVLVHRVIARLNVGGPAMHVVNLALELDREGSFRTRLVAGRITPDEGDMAYYARERGVEVLELDALSRLVSPLSDLRILWSLFRLFRRERPAIVHTHTAKAGTLGRLAALLAGVPVRIHTFHGHVLGGKYFSPRVTRIYVEIERLLARVTSRLVALSERQRREMAGELRIASAERFRVIPLGLELEPFRDIERDAARAATRSALGIAHDETVVGIVGRLVPVKNHELLLRTVEPLEAHLGHPVRILVVGGGLREGELRAYASGIGVDDRVVWLGWRRDLVPLYPAMDVLALVSHDEGTPVAVLEALAAGTPVVARAVGGVPEILEDIPTARLLQGETPAALAEALRDLLVDPGVPGEIEAVRSAIAKRYSVARLAAAMGELYREELARAGIISTERAS